MPLPVVTNGWYLQLRMTLHSTQFAECTIAVISDAVDATAVGEIVGAAWDVNVMPILSEDVRHLDTVVTKLDGVSAGVIVTSEAVGGNGNPAVPDQVSAIVTLRTGLAGRSKRGRIYIPGSPNTAVAADPSQWSTGFITSLGGAVGDFWNDMTTGECTWGVLSRTLGAITPVTDPVLRSYITTQRRRLTGGL